MKIPYNKVKFFYLNSLLYKIKSPIDTIRHFWRGIKFSYQRIKYGFDDSATYSMDYWFCETFYHALKRFQEVSIGISHKYLQKAVDMKYPEGTQYESLSKYDQKYVDQLANQLFDNEITEMLVRLKNMYRYIDSYDYSEKSQAEYAKNKDKFFELLNKNFNELWW